jgi:hypothetical protein
MTTWLKLLAATLAAVMLCALATTAGAQNSKKTPPTQYGMLFTGSNLPYVLQRGRVYDVTYKTKATLWKVRIAKVYLGFPSGLRLLKDGSSPPIMVKGTPHWVLHDLNPGGPERIFHVRVLVRQDAQPGKIMLTFRYTAIAKSRTEDSTQPNPAIIARDI